jgi:hypothetical protein
MSRLWLLSACALISLSSTLAHAQDPGEEGGDDAAPEEELGEGTVGAAPGAKAPRPKIEEPEEEGPEPPLVAPAPDLLTGHVQVAGSAGLAVPLGYLEAGVKQTDATSSGWAFGADVAYGLSRTVAVGAWGQMLRLGAPSSCSDCKAQSTAFGAFVAYHLVQGTRFDPWASAGLGYRRSKIETPTANIDYAGIEWVRLMVGGDWYAFDKVGIGPYLELDLGRYLNRSPGSLGSGANHWLFATGLRVTLDLPGK